MEPLFNTRHMARFATPYLEHPGIELDKEGRPHAHVATKQRSKLYFFWSTTMKTSFPGRVTIALNRFISLSIDRHYHRVACHATKPIP